MGEYLVKTMAPVEKVEQEKQTFIIRADTYEEALELGRKRFADTYDVDMRAVAADAPNFTRKQGLWACLFMGAAILLSFVGWTTKTGHELVFIKPTLESMLFAVTFYAAFIVRFKGVEDTVASKMDIAFIGVITLLVSTFINVLLVEKTFRFLWIETTVDAKFVLIAAVVLSWLGLKAMSALCMIAVALLALGNINFLSDAMGVWGSAYVLTAFIGFLMYLSVEPKILNSLPIFQRTLKKGLGQVKANMNALGSTSVAATVHAAEKGREVWKNRDKKGTTKLEQSNEKGK